MEKYVPANLPLYQLLTLVNLVAEKFTRRANVFSLLSLSQISLLPELPEIYSPGHEKRHSPRGACALYCVCLRLNNTQEGKNTEEIPLNRLHST